MNYEFNEIVRDFSSLFNQEQKSIINSIKKQDDCFILNVNKNCGVLKHKKPCIEKQNHDCFVSITKDGYYFYCDICKERVPNKELFPNTNAINNSLVVFGIQNNVNNFEAPLVFEQTKLRYPFTYELFRENPGSINDNIDYTKKKVEKFQEITMTHEKMKIIKFAVEYLGFNLSYVKRDNKWLKDNVLEVSENEVYDIFSHCYFTFVSKLQEYYMGNLEKPMINNISYNKHVLLNLSVLYSYICNEKEAFLPILKEYRKYDDLYLEYTEHKNEKFLEKIKYNKGSFMKIEDIYEAYKNWYNSPKIKCVEPLLSQKECKNKITAFLKAKKFKYYEYKRYRVKTIRYYCFKDISLEEL